MSWFPKNCIVLPFDFSDESFAAAEIAVKLVDEISHLHIVHVLPDLLAAEPGVMWGAIDNASRIKKSEQAMADRFSAPEFSGARLVAKVGDPGDEIAKYAEDVVAEMIVIPSHGRKGLSRLLIGSVAERVIRLAHCPVLVFRK